MNSMSHNEMKAKASSDLLAPSPSSVRLQRKCACGQHTAVAGGKCEACRGQREPALQRASINRESESGHVPPIVHDVLHSSGQPLNAGMRQLMESRFGRDFSRVRVHSDERAAESAKAVNALAYTVGRDVVFGAGMYAPHNASGQRLLAHELAHVAQQEGAPSASPARFAIGPSDSREEVEAESAARSVTSEQESGGVTGSSARELLQRQPATSNAEPPDKVKEEKTVVTQPAPLTIPAADVKEAEKKEAGQEEQKGIEKSASIGVETETKREEGKTSTEVAGKVMLEAVVPVTDKLHWGSISFLKNASIGGSVSHLSSVELGTSVQMFSLEVEKVKVPLGLMNLGLSASAKTSAGYNFLEKEASAKFGVSAGAEAVFRRKEDSPFYLKLSVEASKMYGKQGELKLQWSPLAITTLVSLGFTLPEPKRSQRRKRD